MQRYKFSVFTITLLLVTGGIFLFTKGCKPDENRFVSYIVDTKKSNVAFFWKDEKNENFRSIQNLRSWLEKNHKRLVFAMNGGMYKQDNSPLGLYIEKQKNLSPINTLSGDGNFYLNPNGIFYITMDKVPLICKTSAFNNNTNNIKYATQSGPMLVIDGQINPIFKERSDNLNIRNGVGIIADNKVIFAMSKKEMNFYDFASYFKSTGCKNALYLDGFVSRTYLPEKNWLQTDGDFGVIIGVIENQD